MLSRLSTRFTLLNESSKHRTAHTLGHQCRHHMLLLACCTSLQQLRCQKSPYLGYHSSLQEIDQWQQPLVHPRLRQVRPRDLFRDKYSDPKGEDYDVKHNARGRSHHGSWRWGIPLQRKRKYVRMDNNPRTEQMLSSFRPSRFSNIEEITPIAPRRYRNTASAPARNQGDANDVQMQSRASTPIGSGGATGSSAHAQMDGNGTQLHSAVSYVRNGQPQQMPPPQESQNPMGQGLPAATLAG